MRGKDSWPPTQNQHMGLAAPKTEMPSPPSAEKTLPSRLGPTCALTERRPSPLAPSSGGSNPVPTLPT